MPLLDVTEVLTDPDFVSRGLKRIVSAETVGDNGRSTYVETQTLFNGVVTNAQGDILARMAGAAFVKGSITIHTKQTLNVATDGADADIVEWQGKRYTVVDVQDYGHFGRGFWAASCEPIPLV
jgi:hypothetical protein